MNDDKPELGLTIALIATAIYSLVTVGIYSTTMFIPGFAFPFAWLFGCLVSAFFFVHIVLATRTSVSLLPIMIAGIGTTIAQSQAYAEPGYLAITQFIVLITMTASTQLSFSILNSINAKKDQPKPFSPIIFTAILTLLGFAGYHAGNKFGTLSGQGPATQLSDEHLLRQLQSSDMQRRWDAFNYLATERPLFLTELTMSDNPKIKKEAIKTVQTYGINAVITELNRIIREDPDPNRVAAATQALQEIGPTPRAHKDISP